MKIGIIDLTSNTHYTAIMARVRVFQEESNEIILFITENMFKNLQGLLKEGEAKIFIKKKSESPVKFLKKIEGYKFDILFITTLETDIISFLFFNPKKTSAKVFVTFHNANLWLEKYKFDGIKGLIKHLIKRIWIRRIYGACVDSQNAKDYIIKRFNFKKPIMVIPFILYEGTADLSGKENCFRITIPGTLSEERRGYLEVLDEFEKIPEKFKSKICLELLGAPSGNPANKSKQIISKCKALKNKNFNLIFYERFLSPSEYSERLMKSNVIFGPIKMKYTDSSSKRIKEIYGVSKDTGVNFNMISGAKPGLLPKGYKNLKELESSTIYFDNYKEAFNLLIELYKNRDKLKKLKEAATRNSGHFSPHAVRDRIIKSGILE